MPVEVVRPDVDFDKVKAVYADGGVTGKNPSPLGGTWAFCYVTEAGGRLYGTGGHVTPGQVGLPAVTNNLTELVALLLALEQLPEGWEGPAYTDSLITLRRFDRPRKAKFDGIPDVLRGRVAAAVERLGKVTLHLLSGHPTAEHLRTGVGKRGYPVSVHNQWCDRRCGEESEKFRRGRAT